MSTRNTNGNVPITDVSLTDIKKILNNDKSNIKDTDISLEDFFTDNESESNTNDIYNDFIDETYCSADEEEIKKDKLTRTPFSWGHFRNYGGVEDVTDTTPKIYWNDIITALGGNAIPSDSDVVAEFSSTNKYPTITIYPNIDNTDEYIDSNVKSSKGLYTDMMSVMYRSEEGSDLNQSDLATKIGIDYDGTPSGLPSFEVKIIASIAGESLISYKNGVATESLDIMGGVGAVASAIPPVTVSAFASAAVGEYVDLKAGQWAIAKFGGGDLSAWSDLIGNAAPSTIGPMMASMSMFFAVFLVVELIWSKTHDEAHIEDALYQYQQAVLGMYTFNDVKSSAYSIGCGSKNYFTDNSSENIAITEDGDSYSFDLNSPNYGEDFNVDTNQIPLFPNNSPVRDKYLNFKFFPSSTQYDYNTPPPVIEYLVELVPLKNCTLHPDKITAFSVKIMPDKYLAPEFSITTDVYEGNVHKLYDNTSITFHNARFVDYIFNAAQSKTDDILGLFGDYYDTVVGSDANFNYNKQTDPSFYGDAFGNDITWYPKKSPIPFTYPKSVLADDGLYNVAFMQEGEQNRIFNPFFRLENDDTVGRKQAEMTKFWEYSDSLRIKSGALLKESTGNGTCYLSQPLINVAFSNTNYPNYYILKLKTTIDSGELRLKTTSTCFYDGIYDKHNGVGSHGSSKKTRSRVKTIAEWADTGLSGINIGEVIYPLESYNVEIEPGSIIFSESGYYSILLDTLITPTSEEIRFEFNDAFIGNITECQLVRLPHSEAQKDCVFGGDNQRGSYNAITKYNQEMPQFKWITDNLRDRELFLAYQTSSGASQSCNIILGVDTDNSVTITAYSPQGVAIDTITYINSGTVSEEYTYSKTTSVFDSTEVKVIKVTVSNTKDTDDSSYLYPSSLTSLECHDTAFQGLFSEQGALVDSKIDLSNSGFTNAIDVDDDYKVFFTSNGALSSLFTNLKELDLSYTGPSRDVSNDSSSVRGSSSWSISNLLANVSDVIDVSNSHYYGTLDNIINTTKVVCVDTDIISYGLGTPNYDIGTNPNITWKNADGSIPVNELGKLVLKLDETWMEDGYLDIAGGNPEITDETTLKSISSLVDDKNWNVLYNDAVAPVITLLGNNPVSSEVLESYTDAGATALDSNDGNLTSSIIVENNVDINTIGLYEVTYNVTDNSGNTANEVSRTVNIVDTTMPVITLLGDNPLTWTLGETFVDPGATAYDNLDGDITSSIIASDNIDINTEGSYQVTYNVADSSENIAEEVVREVVVKEVKTIWGTEIVEVTNPVTGRTWMDRNIGATRAATSSTDKDSYGSLFQWGRDSDGHEIRTSSTTTTQSSTDVPGHDNFIIESSDWRSPQNDNLWQGIIVDGYRLPTEVEWEAERTSWSSNNSAGAYASSLKLPLAGYRSDRNGLLHSEGSYGYYWSSTISGSAANALHFRSSNAVIYKSIGRAAGFSVRLIKDI